MTHWRNPDDKSQRHHTVNPWWPISIGVTVFLVLWAMFFGVGR